MLVLVLETQGFKNCRRGSVSKELALGAGQPEHQDEQEHEHETTTYFVIAFS